jgi:hypothetical protein
MRFIDKMKAILEIIQGKKRASKRKLEDEVRYFKCDFIGYYALYFEGNIIEFWAYPIPHPFYDDGEIRMVYDNGKEPIPLGKFEDGTLTRPHHFHGLSMPLQRGAIKLWKMAGVYG